MGTRIEFFPWLKNLKSQFPSPILDTESSCIMGWFTFRLSCWFFSVVCFKHVGWGGFCHWGKKKRVYRWLWTLGKVMPIFQPLFQHIFKFFNEKMPTGKNDGSYLGILFSPVVMTLAQIWDFTFILFNIKIWIGFVLSWSYLILSTILSTNILCWTKEMSESYLLLKRYVGLFGLALNLNHFLPFLQGWRMSIVSDRDPHGYSFSDK